MRALFTRRVSILATLLAVLVVGALSVSGLKPAWAQQFLVPNSIPDTALVDGTGSPVFTISSGCATVSALVGSGTGGSWATTASTCTPVIVFNVPAAKNGWWCDARDITSGHAVVFTQTASSTTGCTVTGTTTSGDTVLLNAKPF
jgi:hypothetical protein